MIVLRLVLSGGIAFSLLTCGCEPANGGDYERVRHAVFPVFPPPFTAAQTTELRSGFAWTSTEAMAEVDEEGNPALHYVLMLVDSPATADLLRLSGLYFDTMPLFPEEQRLYSGKSGYIAFEGDDAGTFVFALLPASSFNALRMQALQGSPVVPVVIAREIPDNAARLPSGAVSYSYLVAHGFTGIGPHDPMTGQLAADVSGSTRLSDVLRGHVQSVREALGPSLTDPTSNALELRLRLYLTDAHLAFHTTNPQQPGSGYFAEERNLLRRTWGSPTQRGRMLAIEGAPVLLMRGIGRVVAPLDRNNFVRSEYQSASGPERRAAVYVDLTNRAGMISRRGLFPDRVKLWEGDASAEPMRLEAEVFYAPMQILAQASDVHAYAASVLDAAPAPAHIYDARRSTMGIRPGGATCLAGMPREVLSGLPTPESTGETWSAVLESLASEAFAAPPDVVVDFGREKRHVPTYRYAQHVLCSLMERTPGQLASFGPAMVSIDQVADTSHPGRIAMASMADLLTSQVVGATLYFYPDLRATYLDNGVGGSYCDAFEQNLQRVPCMDDNIGGTVGAFPAGQSAPTVGNESAFEIGRAATIISDFLDGHPALADDMPGNGTGWFVQWLPSSRGPVLWLAQPPIDYDLPRDPHFADENVALDGTIVAAAVEHAWTRAHSVAADPWSAAFTSMALERGVAASEVCILLAQHTSSGNCEDLVGDLEALSAAPTP